MVSQIVFREEDVLHVAERVFNSNRVADDTKRTVDAFVNTHQLTEHNIINMYKSHCSLQRVNTLGEVQLNKHQYIIFGIANYGYYGPGRVHIVENDPIPNFPHIVCTKGKGVSEDIRLRSVYVGTNQRVSASKVLADIAEKEYGDILVNKYFVQIISAYIIVTN